jgi:hypothetical protein
MPRTLIVVTMAQTSEVGVAIPVTYYATCMS